MSADSKTQRRNDGHEISSPIEKSVVIASATDVKSRHVSADCSVTVLKDKLATQGGATIFDAPSFISKRARVAFSEEPASARQALTGVGSLCTCGPHDKVSDPIIFGHAVRVFFKDLIAKHDAVP